MEEIKILNDRKTSNIKKSIGFFIGSSILLSGTLIHSLYVVIFGTLIIPFILINKYSIVNDDGIIIVYDILFYKYKVYWDYIDVSELYREASKKTENISLHFLKGSMSKRLVLNREDSVKVMNMAVKKNNKLHVSYIN